MDNQTAIGTLDRPLYDAADNKRAAWGSDIAAEMLRRLEIEFISLVPGASYRGLHDSIVNYLGNSRPQMVPALTEQVAVAIAHGYAKVTGRPMAVALHANIGLMHGSINIFDAWCDKVPMIVVGGTGPVDAARRRPWVDWIHTARDQASLVRDFTKWDDQPASVPAMVESFVRAGQIACTSPQGPVYLCLDATLQEAALNDVPALPDMARYRPGATPSPSASLVVMAAQILRDAKSPVILIGRMPRDLGGWDQRVLLAERLGARVYTAARLAAAFPTGHTLHEAVLPFILESSQVDALARADVVLSLNFPDLPSTLAAAWPGGAPNATIIHASLEQFGHKPWAAEYLAVPPIDLFALCDADALVASLLAELGHSDDEKILAIPPYEPDVLIGVGRIGLSDLARHVLSCLAVETVTFTSFPINWPTSAYRFMAPLDFLGSDAGGVVGAGPAFAIGAALGLRDTGRLAISVIGDGNFLSGMAALWTAARMRIPVLFITNNNRSFYNDEMHQDRVALTRDRPRSNKWIGQRLDDPAPDLAALARAQGVEAIGPISDLADLAAALAYGVSIVKAGRPCVVDVLIDPEL